MLELGYSIQNVGYHQGGKMELENEEVSKLESYAKNKGINAVQMATRFTSVYNKMDGRCRSMVLSNPRRPMNEYCEKCQQMMREVLG